MELVAVLVEEQHLAAPGLVDFAGEDFTHLLGVFLIDIGLLDIHNAALEILADVQDSTAAECGERELLGIGVADLVVVVTAVLADLFESHFGCGILHLLDNLEVLVDFAGSLVDVYDDVEVVRGTVSLGDLGKEHVFEHAHHHRAVDVLLFLEVLEGINQSYFFFFVHLSWYLLLVTGQHLVGFFGADARRAYRKGIVFDVAVEGCEHGAVHVFAVGEVGPAFLVDGYLDVVVVVEFDGDDAAGALCGGLFQYWLKFFLFHNHNKK